MFVALPECDTEVVLNCRRCGSTATACGTDGETLRDALGWLRGTHGDLCLRCRPGRRSASTAPETLAAGFPPAHTIHLQPGPDASRGVAWCLATYLLILAVILAIAWSFTPLLVFAYAAILFSLGIALMRPSKALPTTRRPEARPVRVSSGFELQRFRGHA